MTKGANDSLLGMSRESIHAQLRGTHDIAKAAELVAAEGSVSYWQQSYEGERVPGDFNGYGDQLRNADHLNCFEFVHMLNVLTCCSDHPRNQGMSNLETQLFDVKSGFNEWDGRSPIPRGSVVVGTTPAFGSGSKGVYHVGVSTGDGKVVSNRNGQNVTREPIGDVFGSMFYKVYYGPYPHCRCDETEDHRSAHEPVPGATGTMHELPSLAAQNASRVGWAAVTVVFALVFVGIGAARFVFGSTPTEPTPLPTLPRVTASSAPTTAPPTANPAVFGAPRPAPIVAVFRQEQFTTSYTVAVDDPGGVPYTVHWTGPNCGTWGPQGESTGQAAQAQWAMQWAHPHPPCPATTNHSDVTVTFTLAWSGGTLICVYQGSESGTGPACKPF